MKKLIIILFAILLMSTKCYAEVYVLFDKSTKEVKSISKQDDAVLQEGWEKVILKGNFSDYPLSYQADYYTFEDGRFVVNVDKLSKEANAIKKAKKRAKELMLIEKKKSKIAYEALKAEGETFEEIKDKDFE